MMKSWLVALAMGALAIGPAFAQDQSPPAQAEADSPYVVLRENVRVPFASRTINGFQIGVDRRSVIFDGTGRHWYRGELDRGCARDLRWEHRIGLDLRRGFDTLDRFTWILIDGRRCALRSLDEIADPRDIARPEDAAEPKVEEGASPAQ